MGLCASKGGGGPGVAPFAFTGSADRARALAPDGWRDGQPGAPRAAQPHQQDTQAAVGAPVGSAPLRQWDAAAALAASPAAADSIEIAVPVAQAHARSRADPAKLFLRAIKDGDLAAVTHCWEANSAQLDLERRSMWENTPLTCAAYYGHEAVALKLLELGADPAAENEHGCTALLYAAVESMPRLMRALLLVPAVAASLASGRKASVYSRATDETAERTPLLAAAECGFVEGVQMLLLAHGALADDGDSDAAGGSLAIRRSEARSALVLAARRGRAQVCDLLLASGAPASPSPASDGDCTAAGNGAHTPSPLRVALAHGHAEAALVIVARAPLAASIEPELLPLSVAKGMPAAVLRALVGARASVDTPGEDGMCALHIAARRNDAVSTRLLVELGAALSATDRDGRTAQQLAELHGHMQLGAELGVLEAAQAHGFPDSGAAATSQRVFQGDLS